MIFFLEQRHILDVPAQIAGYIAPLFMLLAMIGRFGGSVLLRYAKATTLLTLVGAGASILCLVIIATYDMAATPLGGTITLPGGYVAPLTMGFVPAVAALLLGLMNSIMFPTIFTLTLERSTAPASATSGLMCMAICGGGFVSILYGAVIDAFAGFAPDGARSLAFVVPLVCYLYVLWYARAALKAPTHVIEEMSSRPSEAMTQGMTNGAVIAIDWGTTNRRAYRIEPDGRIGDRVEGGAGVLGLAPGDYAPALAICARGSATCR